MDHRVSGVGQAAQARQVLLDILLSRAPTRTRSGATRTCWPAPRSPGSRPRTGAGRLPEPRTMRPACSAPTAVAAPANSVGHEGVREGCPRRPAGLRLVRHLRADDPHGGDHRPPPVTEPSAGSGSVNSSSGSVTASRQCSRWPSARSRKYTVSRRSSSAVPKWPPMLWASR